MIETVIIIFFPVDSKQRKDCKCFEEGTWIGSREKQKPCRRSTVKKNLIHYGIIFAFDTFDFRSSESIKNTEIPFYVFSVLQKMVMFAYFVLNYFPHRIK